jgi:RimK family alpha-L-glutamate ligase
MHLSPDANGKDEAAPTILLVTDQQDWHARQMEAAFGALGAKVVRADLAFCGFDTQSPSGLTLPALQTRLPDAVHVRTLAGGSFEAVTKRLGVLHALSALGVVVWNEARAIERCVDKSMTSFLLARAGLPTPRTWALESLEAARALVERETLESPLVLKPLFGAQGKGLRLIRGPPDLPPPEAVAGVYYLQRFSASSGEGHRDFRLFVLAGGVVAAMMREAPTWITNVKQGGRPWAIAPDPAMQRLAVAAAQAVSAAVAGVDILVGPDGQPTVLEVNSMPAWNALQQVSARDIAAAIAAALLDEAARRSARGRLA